MQDVTSDQNESGLQAESVWQHERSPRRNLCKMLSIEKLIDYQRKDLINGTTRHDKHTGGKNAKEKNDNVEENRRDVQSLAGMQKK